IQIEKHCRAFRGRHQQLSKVAEDMRTDGIHLVARGEPSVRIFAPEDIEVIEPEIRHHFLELALTMYCPDDFLCLQLQQDLLRYVEGGPDLELPRLRRTRIVFEQLGGAHPD